MNEALTHAQSIRFDVPWYPPVENLKFTHHTCMQEARCITHHTCPAALAPLICDKCAERARCREPYGVSPGLLRPIRTTPTHTRHSHRACGNDHAMLR